MVKRKTETKKRQFLEAIAKGDRVTTATDAIGIDRTLPYIWYQNDEKFAEAWDQIRNALVPMVRDTAFAQALAGDGPMIRYILDRYGNTAGEGQSHIREIEIIMPSADDDQQHDFMSFN